MERPRCRSCTASPFGYHDLDEWKRVALGQAPGHIYSRNTNPTVEAFEHKVRVARGRGIGDELCDRDGGDQQHALCVPQPGDRVVSIRTVRRHQQALHRVSARYEIASTLCTPVTTPAIEAPWRRLHSALSRVTDQPDGQGRRHRDGSRCRGTTQGRAGRGRQHLCDADQSESIGAWRRHGGA